MANISKSTAKVKLNLLKVFSGKQTELNKFIKDVLIYLTVNKEVYNNNEKKITYLLSFMTEGDAALWKEEFLARKIKEAEKKSTLHSPTYSGISGIQLEFPESGSNFFCM